MDFMDEFLPDDHLKTSGTAIVSDLTFKVYASLDVYGNGWISGQNITGQTRVWEFPSKENCKEIQWIVREFRKCTFLWFS